MQIILITKHFPFNRGNTPGEIFLDSEIEVLSEKADKVYVIAVDADKNQTPSITLPENVEAIALGSNGKMKGLLGAPFIPVTNDYRFEAKGKPLKNKLFARYFDARARYIVKEAEKFLKNKELTDPVFYSYWLYYHAEAAVLLREKFGGKCFSRAHGYDLYEYNRKDGYLPFRWLIMKGLDFVFPCSVMGSEYLKKSLYGVFRKKVFPCYLGTKDYGLGPEPKENVIVSCSRAVPLKRLDRIAEIMKLLPNVKWIHFGDGPELEKVKAYCKENLPEGSYEFKGFVPNEEVLKFYTESPVSLFVNVSTTEGLPISIMEALSFGIPVVATDVGGVSEVVSDETGRLIDKDFDNQELAGTIRELLKSDSQLRKNCRKVWEDKFRFKTNAEKMLKEVVK